MTHDTLAQGEDAHQPAWLTEAATIALQYCGDHNNAAYAAVQPKELAAILYRDWYVAAGSKPTAKPLPCERYAALYRTAHQGSYLWEPDWQATRVSNAGRVFAIRGSEHRMLDPGDYITPERPGLPPVPGSQIETVSRRDSTESLPGFWFTYSPAWPTATSRLMRLYWNVGIEGSIQLIEDLTREIADNTPYSLKVPLESDGYNRADVAVLYVEENRFNHLSSTLKAIHSRVKTYLYPNIPKLARQLAPGLALAMDPSGKFESFGGHRCRLIAEGVQNALSRPRVEASAVSLEIRNRFVAAGIDPALPYLDAGAEDQYQW